MINYTVKSLTEIVCTSLKYLILCTALANNTITVTTPDYINAIAKQELYNSIHMH